MSKLKVCSRVVNAVLLLSCVSVKSMAAVPLHDSTSLTVVHVTKNKYTHWITPEDITVWPSWPNTDGDKHLEIDAPEQDSRVHLRKVIIGEHQISWGIFPSPTPWRGLPLLNSMIASVWSEDGGKTYILESWDYLAPHHTSKGLHVPFPPNWIGTIIHSFCGFEGESADKCNGRERSNLYFTHYPDI